LFIGKVRGLFPRHSSRKPIHRGHRLLPGLPLLEDYTSIIGNRQGLISFWR
jgi:hypothetical protein